MLGEYDYEESRPFWFAETELLAEVSHAEIKAIMQLFARYDNLSKFFDAPEATIPQRTACFELLAHRKAVEVIEENFLGFYLNPPTFNDEESKAYKRSLTLVSSDAPAWVLEMNEVTERLPVRICEALPEPLREGHYTNDPVKDEAIRSSARTLSTVEQIHALIQTVFGQQLQRLNDRWLVETRSSASAASMQIPNKRKRVRKRDAQRLEREALIAEIAEVTKTPVEFLQMMDERRVLPQPTWKNWPGSWTSAYRDAGLRKLIHQDKSRAVSRVLARRGR